MIGVPLRMLPYTVTIVRAALARDRYNNAVREWSTASRTNTPAWIEQSDEAENTDNRDEQAANWRLIVPATVTIDGRDRVEYDGKTFEVVGPPQTLRTPYGAHHIEARLRWIEG